MEGGENTQPQQEGGKSAYAVGKEEGKDKDGDGDGVVVDAADKSLVILDRQLEALKAATGARAPLHLTSDPTSLTWIKRGRDTSISSNT